MRLKFVIASILMLAITPFAHAFTTFIPPCASFINFLEPPKEPVIAGEPFTITAHAGTFGSFTSNSYQWFRGPKGDTSSGVIGVGPTLTTTETDTSSYWLKLTASCGDPVSAEVTVPLAKGACAGSAGELCVDNLRYRVTLQAAGPNGDVAKGVALYETNSFGYFSLPAFTGDASVPEVMVKVLGPVDDVPWVFYSGLTNLDYRIDVVDTLTGKRFKSYHVAAPHAGSEVSFGNFDVDGYTSEVCSNVTVQTSAISTPPECKSGENQLCLLDRFLVTMGAHDLPSRSDRSGAGVALPATGAFGFFSVPAITGERTNVESFVKMIDATSSFNHYWVFLGGLTDFELTVTVTDTHTGLQKIYTKAAGSTCGINDTNAF